MKTRLISAACMLPMLIFLVVKGWALLAASFVISALAMFEFYRGFKNIDIYPNFTVGFISLICLYIIIIWGEYISGHEPRTYAHLILLWVFGTVFVGLLIMLFKENQPVSDGAITSIGALYIGFFFAHIPLVSMIRAYENMVWIIFIAAWCSDAFALFAGMLFGKHQLCPEISPKKTVEGAIGGALGGSVCSAIFSMFFIPSIGIHGFIIGLLGAVISQLGDLIASVFKRKMGIKDYGNLIPGHGGAMDRFDSIILVAPLVYYYILVVLRP